MLQNNEQRFDSFTKYIKIIISIIFMGYMIQEILLIQKDYVENFEKKFYFKWWKKFYKISRTDENLDDLVSNINELNPDLILICANSIDSARVVQYMRMKGIKTQIASSEWAMTPAFIENS